MLNSVYFTEEKLRELALSVFETFSAEKFIRLSNIENQFIEKIGLMFEDDGTNFNVVVKACTKASLPRDPDDSDWKRLEDFFSSFEIELTDSLEIEDGKYVMEFETGGDDEYDEYSDWPNEFCEAFEKLVTKKLSQTEWYVINAHNIDFENDGYVMKVFRIDKQGERELKFSLNIDDSDFYSKSKNFFKKEEFFYY